MTPREVPDRPPASEEPRTECEGCELSRDHLRKHGAEDRATPPSLDVERLRDAIRWEFHDNADQPLDDKRALLAAIAVEIGYRTGQPAMFDDVHAEYDRLNEEPDR